MTDIFEQLEADPPTALERCLQLGEQILNLTHPVDEPPLTHDYEQRVFDRADGLGIFDIDTLEAFGNELLPPYIDADAHLALLYAAEGRIAQARIWKQFGGSAVYAVTELRFQPLYDYQPAVRMLTSMRADHRAGTYDTFGTAIILGGLRPEEGFKETLHLSLPYEDIVSPDSPEQERALSAFIQNVGDTLRFASEAPDATISRLPRNFRD